MNFFDGGLFCLVSFFGPNPRGLNLERMKLKIKKKRTEM